MELRPLTDKHIRDLLLAIDESEEIIVTTLEAEFFDSAVYKGGECTVEQRARAAKIVEKYRHQL